MIDVNKDDEIDAFVGTLMSYGVTPEKYKEIYESLYHHQKKLENDLGLFFQPMESM